MTRGCGTCGKAEASLRACAGCRQVYYCSRECQKKHWKKHKKECRKHNNKERRVRQEPLQVVIPSPSPDTPSICGACNIKPLQDGPMCISCGTFLLCSTCNTKPEFGARNGRQVVACHLCPTCSEEVASQREPLLIGKALQALLEQKPAGGHVNMAKLMLAQCQYHDATGGTGIVQDVQAAIAEIQQLADIDNYAYAQFVMASFHDPDGHAQGVLHVGPLNLETIDDSPVAMPPCRPSWETALHYYNQAAEQKFTMAIQTLGTMYKNGEGVTVNKSKAFALLQEAADDEDARAMCNLGRMMMQGDGVPEDFDGGLEYFRRAATEFGIHTAMFMLAQFGMKYPSLKSEGRAMTEQLAEQDWDPPPPMEPMWPRVLMFYGV